MSASYQGLIKAINPVESKLNFLLMAIPICCYFAYVSHDETNAFFASIVAIMPLAFLMGHATEEEEFDNGVNSQAFEGGAPAASNEAPDDMRRKKLQRKVLKQLKRKPQRKKEAPERRGRSPPLPSPEKLPLPKERKRKPLLFNAILKAYLIRSKHGQRNVLTRL